MWRHHLRLPAGVIALNAVCLVATAQAHHSGGWGGGLVGVWAAFLLAPPVLLGCFSYACLAQGPRSPRIAAATLAAALVLVGPFIVMLGNIRACDSALRTIVAAGTPLIAALTRYERKVGVPPPTLDALVPEYLTAVPGTGVPCHPTFRYGVGEQGHRWKLEVYTAHTFGTPRSLLYWPEQDYVSSGLLTPERRERLHALVDGWAFVAP